MNAKTLGLDAGTPRALGRKVVVRVVVIVDRKPELLHVVRALHTTSRLARSLNRRKKKTN